MTDEREVYTSCGCGDHWLFVDNVRGLEPMPIDDFDEARASGRRSFSTFCPSCGRVGAFVFPESGEILTLADLQAVPLVAWRGLLCARRNASVCAEDHAAAIGEGFIEQSLADGGIVDLITPKGHRYLAALAERIRAVVRGRESRGRGDAVIDSAVMDRRKASE